MTLKTKPTRELTLRDRLSRLSYSQACRLLGDRGEKLIQEGAKQYEIDVRTQTRLTRDEFRVKVETLNQPVVVTIGLRDDYRDRLAWKCSACHGPCRHVGVALATILEHKMLLGLSAMPDENVPLERLSEPELVERAIAERRARAKEEKMKVRSADPEKPWVDYTVTTMLSGKSYRVALRGLGSGDSYCSCPDFRTNTLGTCKHLLKVEGYVKKKFTAEQLRRPYERKRLSLHVRYGHEAELHFGLPRRLPDEAAKILGPLGDGPIRDFPRTVRCLSQLEKLGHSVAIYPDAEEFLEQRLFQERIQACVAEIRRDPAQHALRNTLLRVPLLPYQLDGIAFALGAGRAVLADDMGLGKTIQGVGVAELLAREADIRKVLIVCPASVKSQWRSEIQRFCGRSVQLVQGPVKERHADYASDAFFTVCNYEQVLRDILAIEATPWDLIVLDEGQRIKNWEAKTSRVIKGLRSPFALVLSGTPLENRLEELYSVVQFIDDRRLAPAFRFFHRHRVVDEAGKIIGYKNLTDLRDNLKPILLRRTRESVKLELPPRSTEIVRIPPSDEQLELHRSFAQIITTIVSKAYITEMDLLRLQRSLLMCRMTANSTFLVTKEAPAYSTKLERLDELLEQLFAEDGRKVVMFSEWTTMLDLIEPLLRKRGLRFVRLDGSVPQKNRQVLVQEFQTEPECRLFLSTNAGATGLNLQAANTVINVDLPWNPAVLEQRIGRAHRMGQLQPVQVFVLITEGTMEERILLTLAAKKDLALAALDADATIDSLEVRGGMEELKKRLEVLLGARPEAEVDQSQQQQVKEDSARFAEQRERVAQAGGELLGAAFRFLGELVTQQAAAPAAAPEVVTEMRNRLTECAQQDPDGKQRLTITFPDRSALESLANTLATLLAVGKA